MATNRMKEAKQAVIRWCAKRRIKLLSPPRHIHPTCYVVGYAAPQCLIVARPWMDSEPQVAAFDKVSPLTTVNLFDSSLKPGDWCVLAYVQRMGSGERLAIPIPPTRDADGGRDV